MQITRPDARWLAGLAAVLVAASPAPGPAQEPYAKPTVRLREVPPPGAPADTARPAAADLPRPTNLAPQIYRGKPIVDFRWTGVPNAAYYRLFRSAGAYGPWTLVNDRGSYTQDPTQAWARDYNGAVGGPPAYYKVVAMLNGGGGSDSEPVQVTIPTGPQGPRDLRATTPAPGTVELRWTHDAEATSYTVWRFRNHSTLERRFEGVLPASGPMFRDTGLQAGVAYRYSVVARYPDYNTTAEAGANATPY
jgi:hypothetical protein